MKSTISRILSLILTIAMLIQILPVSAFAQESNTTDSGEIDVIGLVQDSSQTQSEALQDAKILFEEEELRESDVKHFRLDDGSYIAVQYGTPVHYEDNGQWVDYDNTLRETKTLDGSGVSHYTIANGDSIRVFAADANAEALLTMAKGDYSLSLTPIKEADAELPVTPIPPVEMELMNMGEDLPIAPASILCYSGSGEDAPGILTAEEASLHTQIQPDTMYSALEYSQALNGATLRYENYGNTVKESIVIHEPQATYAYDFLLET